AGAGAFQELPYADGCGHAERDEEQAIKRKRLAEDDHNAAQEIGDAGGKRLRAPDDANELAQHDSKTEGQQEIGAAIAPAVERAQEDALKRHSYDPDENRREQ